MPKFRLSVVEYGFQKSETLLYVEAPGPELAVAMLQDQGADVLSVEAVEFFSPEIAKAASLSAANFSLLLFCQELIVLLEAGLTIVEGIRALYQKEAHVARKAIFLGILTGLSEGQKLSDVCSVLSHLFPPFFIASISAHELTGSITEGLKRYLSYAEEMGQLKNKLTNMMIYPAIVVSVGLLVIFFLLLVVLPKFSMIFENARYELPWISKNIMLLSLWLNTHTALVMTLLCLIIASVFSIFRFFFLYKHIVQPIVSFFLRWKKFADYHRARVFRTMSLLLEAGLRLPQVIILCKSLVSVYDQKKLNHILTVVEEGGSFIDALDHVGWTDPIMRSLLSAGEKSGALSHTLLSVAIFREQSFSRWIEKFVRIVEPLLMMLLGGMIGGVLILVYMPIFDIASGVL